jgi:hypothetical protein
LIWFDLKVKKNKIFIAIICVKCFRIFRRLHNEWKLEKLVFKGYTMNEKLGEKVTKVTQWMKIRGENLRRKVAKWMKEITQWLKSWTIDCTMNKRLGTNDENLIWGGGTFIHCATFF